MSKARYKQGRKINSISEFASCKSPMYKWNGRTRHRSVLMSLQYRTLLDTIISGRLYTAELIDTAESEAKHTDKGCESCKYEDEPEFTSPCVDCSRNHKDMWEAKR